MQDVIGSPRAPIRSPFGRAAALAFHWHRRWRSRRALHQLLNDPHLLKDVGLAPEDVLREHAKPFWRG